MPTAPCFAKPTCDQPASDVCPVLPATNPPNVPTRLSVERTQRPFESLAAAAPA